MTYITQYTASTCNNKHSANEFRRKDVMKRERVNNAIHHQQTNVVPYNIELTNDELKKVLVYLKMDKKEFDDWVGNYFDKIDYNIGGTFIKPGYFKDEYGVIWNRSGLDKDIGNIDELLLKEPDIKGFEFPEVNEDAIRKITEKILSNGKDTIKLGKIGLAYYERAWSLRGMENLLMDFLTEQKFVEELFDRILQYNIKIIDIALQYDIDGFYFGDDYGQQNGLIMSPQVWRKFIKPGLAKMFDRIKSSGRVVALHSCGNIIDLFGDMIDIGLDIYQTFQPEIYDLRQVKANYGDDLTFWGGISTQQTLPYVKPYELKEIVKETMGIMSVNGGYIAAPTHRVPADVPVENIVALIETLKEQ